MGNISCLKKKHIRNFQNSSKNFTSSFKQNENESNRISQKICNYKEDNNKFRFNNKYKLHKVGYYLIIIAIISKFQKLRKVKKTERRNIMKILKN